MRNRKFESTPLQIMREVAALISYARNTA